MRPDDPLAPSLTSAVGEPHRRTSRQNPAGLSFPILPFAAAQPPAESSGLDAGLIMNALKQLQRNSSDIPDQATLPQDASPVPILPRKPPLSPRRQALRDGTILKVAKQGENLLIQVGQGQITLDQAHASYIALTERADFSPNAITQLRTHFIGELPKAARRGQNRPPTAIKPVQPQPAAHIQAAPPPQDLPFNAVRQAASSHVVREAKTDQLSLPDETSLIQVERAGKSDRIDPSEDIVTLFARKIRESQHSLDQDFGNGRSINDTIDAAGDVTDAVTRNVVGDIFGEEVVQSRDDINDAFATVLTELRSSLHRAIDRSGARAESSPQRIADFKLIADTLIGAITVIGPGRRPRRRRVRGADEPDESAESNPRPSGDTSQSPQVRPDDEGVSLSVAPGLPVVKVKTERLRSSNARRGTREWEMLNNPHPNTIYELDNGETFKTDAFGNAEEFVYVPVADRRGRDRRQTQIGNEGLDNDVGGHLRACFLGGSCDLYNLISQDRRFNNGDFRKWEIMIGRNIDNVEAVKITVKRKNPSNRRPDGLVAEWVLDGVRMRTSFKNEE